MKLLTAFLALASTITFAADQPDTSGWKHLFAADLSNAVDASGWQFDGKELVAKNHDTIWTKESYGDFILDLEFKVAKESNSGVFLRSGDIKNGLAALEIPVHESPDGSKYGMLGAIYDAMPPVKNAAKPVGEWNRYTITCKGPQVTVVLNGETWGAPPSWMRMRRAMPSCIRFEQRSTSMSPRTASIALTRLLSSASSCRTAAAARLCMPTRSSRKTCAV